VFVMRLTTNRRFIQKCDHMLGYVLAIRAGLIVIEKAGVLTSLERSIVRQTWMDTRGIKILFRVRGHRKESMVDVRCVAAALNRGGVLGARPIVVLHQNDEDRLNIVLRLREV